MVCRGQPLGILDAARHASNAASSLHRIQPLLLLWPQPAGWGLDLDAGKHGDALADHLLGDRARCPADQVSTALAQAELHRTAIGILKGAGVIAEDFGIAPTDGKSYFLLNTLLRQSCSTTGGRVATPHCSAMASATP